MKKVLSTILVLSMIICASTAVACGGGGNGECKPSGDYSKGTAFYSGVQSQGGIAAVGPNASLVVGGQYGSNTAGAWGGEGNQAGGVEEQNYFYNKGTDNNWASGGAYTKVEVGAKGKCFYNQGTATATNGYVGSHAHGATTGPGTLAMNSATNQNGTSTAWAGKIGAAGAKAEASQLHAMGYFNQVGGALNGGWQAGTSYVKTEATAKTGKIPSSPLK